MDSSLQPTTRFEDVLRWAVFAAGLAQILLCMASLAIPRILHWREDLAQLRALTRHVFWTYAAYILGPNGAFGLVSSLAPQGLLDGTGLARAVAGFIAVYWGARLAVQFFYFDRRSGPQGSPFKLAEAVLVTLFIGLAAVYTAAAILGGRL